MFLSIDTILPDLGWGLWHVLTSERFVEQDFMCQNTPVYLYYLYTLVFSLLIKISFNVLSINYNFLRS